MYVQTFEDFNPTLGVEIKAIRITSDSELQIVVYKSNLWDADAYTVPSQPANDSVYFTTAYVGNGQYCFFIEKQFYLVTTFYDDTFISVTQQDGVSYEVELPNFGTFVQTTTDPNNRVASGTKISSSKHINVISGNVCTYNRAAIYNGFDGAYASNIPSVGNLGQVYVVPRISNGYPDAGFSVSVVAATNDTIVECDGDVRYLDGGQTAIFEYPLLNNSIFVNCSEPCLVTQYSKSTGSSLTYGLFMSIALPDKEFSTSAYFSNLEIHPPSHLNLVVTGELPGDDLYLNGESLGSLTWTAINGYTTAVMTVPEGTNYLESLHGRPFAAYIYGHDSGDKGAGYALLPSESSRPTTSATLPPSSSSTVTTITASTTTQGPSTNTTTYPQLMARVNGTALSSDGQEIPPECAVVSIYISPIVVFVNQTAARDERILVDLVAK